MKKHLFILAAVGIVTFQTVSTSAFAESSSRRPSRSNSLFTVGVGMEFGWGRYQPIEDELQNAFVAELGVRLRLFRILGAQFSYNLMNAANTGELCYSSKFRISVVLYLLPTEHISIYLVGGYGALDIQDLGTVTGATNSYHAGVGAEIYIGRRFAISLEYLWTVPGYATMEAVVSERLEAATPHPDDIDGGVSMERQMSVPELSFTDFLDAGNFQLNLGVRFYI